MKKKFFLTLLLLVSLFFQFIPLEVFAQNVTQRLEVATGGLLIRNPLTTANQSTSLYFLSGQDGPSTTNTAAKISSQIVSINPLKSTLELLVNNGSTISTGLKIDENKNTHIMGNLYNSDGTNSSPSYTFFNQPNTGMGRVLNDRLGFVINGIPRAAFLNDGTFVVSDSPSDFGIGGGTAPGSIVSGHNRYFRSVDSTHSKTVRLIGIAESNDVVVGGEFVNTNGSANVVRLDSDTVLLNGKKIMWRDSTNSDGDKIQVLDIDNHDYLNIGKDNAIEQIKIFGETAIYPNDSASSPVIIFSENGNINTSGTITTRGCTGCADLAEDYLSDQILEAGEVVSISEDGSGKVKKTNLPYDQKILGVISSSPAIRIGEDGGVVISKGDNTKSKDGYPVALTGRVPVKVSTENGVIKPGDYLTSSSIPGVAMKADKKGKVVGMALDGYEQEKIGRIRVFIDITWFYP